MLRNYLLIGLRNLRKHFTYSLINIFGLGIGLATCLLLVTWIMHELSYDRFHAKADRIYRSSVEMSFGGQTFRTAVSPSALLPALQEFPEVETGVRVYNPAAWNPYIVKKDDRLFQEGKFYFADSTFFSVFTFDLLKGNPAKALTAPNSVILTERMARKYFGDEDPIGKTLNVNSTKEYTVTGLMRDVPANSFLQFDFLGSFSSLRAGTEPVIWNSANYQTFVVVHPGADISALAAKTDEVARKNMGRELESPSDYVKYNFSLLTDLHLRSTYENEFEPVGNIQYVYIFSAVALLIMLIACINYVNLATARAADRAKEVGVRKVVGAIRSQLLKQFLGESFLITVLAFLLAFGLAVTFLPLFNAITGKELSASSFARPDFLGLSLVMLIVIALLSGAYPAFAITSFRPVSMLKGNFRFSGKGIWLRKALVVTQFCISLTLIVGTIVIVKQLGYIQDKKLGYKKENVIILPLDQKTREAYSQLRTELSRNSDVVSVGRATESPTRIQGGYGFSIEGGSDATMILTAVAVDSGFVPAVGLELIAGRNYNMADHHRMKNDTLYSFIVNESLLRAMFLDPSTAIGKRARLSGRRGEIVGVVSDFHFASLHTAIAPIVMFNQEDYNHIFVKVSSDDIRTTLDRMKAICASIIPHRPFEYQFLDQQYERMYASEARMGTIFTVFAALAIIIACLGLFGLVSFTAAQKTKEIGIRKVLGATPPGIVLLITREFTRLVLVAIAIGIPLAYWMMSEWLDGFAYRTSIGVIPIVAASLICLLTALGTAGYQAVKAALIDPANTLRNE